MRISFVVATDRAGTIGDDRGLPWRLPTDLKRFKRLTMGKPILMGRTTHEHIGRPLPGRLNIVLSRRPNYAAPGCEVAADLDAGLAIARASGADEVMIVGGAQVYRAAFPKADRVHLTLVEGIFPGTVRIELPLEGSPDWLRTHEEFVPAGGDDPFDSTYFLYERVGRP